MIKYKLICENCNISFDSWFASSKEYEKLSIKKLLSCHNCSSSKIKKTLMARIPMNKLGNGEDISNSVAFLASDAASYITGETIHVNGGMYMA